MGSEEQRAEISKLLTEFRDSLTKIVPEAATGGPFAGWPMGSKSRSGPPWAKGFPEWLFGGPGAPFGNFGPWGGPGGPRRHQWSAPAGWPTGAGPEDEDPGDEEIIEA